MRHAAHTALLRIKHNTVSETSALNTLSHGIIIASIVAVDYNDLQLCQGGTQFIKCR